MSHGRVASVDEWSNAAASDRVPQRLAALGPAHTMLYDNYVPSITDDGARVRLFAWSLWWTHNTANNKTKGRLVRCVFIFLLSTAIVYVLLSLMMTTASNKPTGSGLGGSLSWFMDDSW